MKRYKQVHALSPKSESFRLLIGILFAIFGLLFSSCNSVEGELPNADEPAYPEFTPEKIDQIIIDLEGDWRNIDPKIYPYKGTRPLLFLQIHDDLVAIDIDAMKVLWTIAESADPESRFLVDLLIFDWEDRLLIVGSRQWLEVNPASGNINQTYEYSDFGMAGPFWGCNVINDQIYTLNFDYSIDSAFVYQYDFSSPQAIEIERFSRPYLDVSVTPFLLPYDKEENQLLVAFPLLSTEGSRGAFFHYLNLNTGGLNEYFLDSMLFDFGQIRLYIPVNFSKGILAFGAGVDYYAYDMQNKKNLWSESSSLHRRYEDYIFSWQGNQIKIFDLQTESFTLPKFYSSDLMTRPLLHPTEDIAVFPYRNRVLFVEIQTGQLLSELLIEEEDTPYMMTFFDTHGRLCILGRDQRLEFFELPI